MLFRPARDRGGRGRSKTSFWASVWVWVFVGFRCVLRRWPRILKGGEGERVVCWVAPPCAVTSSSTRRSWPKQLMQKQQKKSRVFVWCACLSRENQVQERSKPKAKVRRRQIKGKSAPGPGQVWRVSATPSTKVARRKISVSVGRNQILKHTTGDKRVGSVFFFIGWNSGLSCCWPSMLRFLSRRKTRNVGPGSDVADSQIKSQRIPTNKNLVPCRVILLDNTDLPVDLTVGLDWFLMLNL